MSWNDDDDDNDHCGKSYRSAWGNILSAFSFGSVAPAPMTNAGRYLDQLASGDSRFKSAGECISEEMTAALRRIQIVSGRVA